MSKLTRKIRQSLFVSHLLLLGCLPAQALEYEIYARINAGKISGLTQIPKGGNIGTTSINRPSFTELGVDNDYFGEFGMGIYYETFFAILAYEEITPHESVELSNALITHNQKIPAGSDFNMHVHYYWSMLKAGKAFPIPSTALTLSPFVEGSFIQFHYGFVAPLAQSKREFDLAGLSIGFIAQYQFDKAFSIDFTAKNTLPLSNLRISLLDLGINYAYLLKKHLILTLRSSLGFLRIDYQDEQTVPNHIRYQALPYGSLGLSLTFFD